MIWFKPIVNVFHHKYGQGIIKLTLHSRTTLVRVLTCFWVLWHTGVRTNKYELLHYSFWSSSQKYMYKTTVFLISAYLHSVIPRYLRQVHVPCKQRSLSKQTWLTNQYPWLYWDQDFDWLGLFFTVAAIVIYMVFPLNSSMIKMMTLNTCKSISWDANQSLTCIFMHYKLW